ncbi:MAG: Rieske 2Fe-2S domain-containing protein [Rhodocyclales bacterium]|jgi:toluene monooxygenase system ferredoxin subunit|nr:Rieske 2Fe-2S domain-containing protein [Rhodocyclales bacterium]MBH1975938.1 Rieske 2Fe-2S domain-containing protein [Rhodocyclales bacterium]MDD2948560.1 Rieske 2Fe-2S domain-containing protein [Rugosibacter sp.]HQN46475.1 Rieske 2Fe-2S domain-containing protein [Rugosibacter sp.]HQQ36105.1 Rieske 2Fe-2S domain-containing protein [Rugosibacter sp.]
MAFEKVCTLDDLWEGEMASFEVNGHEVLVLSIEGGDIIAYQGICPHQDILLIEGQFDGKALICRAHQWVFDAKTGRGINPDDSRLVPYPVRIEGEDVFIDTEGITPEFSHI